MKRKWQFLMKKKLDNFPKFKKYFNSLESEIKKREFEYGYFTYIEFNES